MKDKTTLSPAELEVLKTISPGLRSQEAADKLCVGKRTVDFHLRNIYRKLKVTNRVAAINEARRKGLI